MTRLLHSPKVDDAAVAAAIEGLRDRGATCQAYMRADGINLCVNAVNAGGRAWAAYSEAASRRAATAGRRMLPVLDGGEIDGRLWIAYDVGSAMSLVDHRSRGALPTATALQVLSDVARALDEAAAEGVFATELPPDSVFVTGKGARLGDIGTARAGLARPRFQLQGDPVYVPPEVLRGKRAGERSGVYLFGALLHYVLTGTAPQPGRAERRESRQPNLPASIQAIVESAMAEDPANRPSTVGEAHEMAKRALRGERPERARKRRGRKTAAAKPGGAKRVVAAKRAIAKTAAAKRVAAVKAATTKRVAVAKTAAAKRIAPAKAAAAKRIVVAKAAAATPRLRFPASPVTPRRALAVGGALVVGGAAGLLLGTSPDPEPARAQTVTAGGMSVTVPSGRHRVEPSGDGLAVRSPGSVLRARIVNSAVPPPPKARPVQLGALQAWRHAAGGVVRYSVPTSRGTLAVACRTTTSRSSRPLRMCERIASTLRLRDVRALPLAAVVEESRRLRTAIATLRTERDSARARLDGASSPDEQRLAAQDLADSHRRAATALHGLTGAGSLEAAARGAAGAYSRLAASAESGSAERWAQATAQVRGGEAALAEAIAAAG